MEPHYPEQAKDFRDATVTQQEQNKYEDYLSHLFSPWKIISDDGRYTLTWVDFQQLTKTSDNCATFDLCLALCV